jgi:hypothetical protein
MFEACTAEAAKAIQATLKVRGEEEGATEPEPEPEPEREPERPAGDVEEGVPPVTQNVMQWLTSTCLDKCADALEDYVDLIDLQEADDDEVLDIIATLSSSVSKPVLRRFKRELAALRGKGEVLE